MSRRFPKRKCRGAATGDTRRRVGQTVVMRPVPLSLALAVLLTLPGATPPPRPTSAADRAEAAMIKRFETLEIEDALIDQQARITARVAALPPHAAAPERPVLAIGGQGYLAIFDREARRAAAVLARRSGGPALVLSNTPGQVVSGLLASRRTMALAVSALGRRAQPGDTLIVYLTSHGGPDASIAMDAPYIEFAPLTADDLAKAMAAAGFRRRIVIVSACYAGSWLPTLANPTTIVIAAAAADRTSFGCDDSRELTLFGEALTGALATPGASLASAFAVAKARIAAEERALKITPSLPQASIGSAMQAEWTATR